MTTYLADSNAFSGYLRGKNPNLVARMRAAIEAGELSRNDAVVKVSPMVK